MTPLLSTKRIIFWMIVAVIFIVPAFVFNLTLITQMCIAMVFALSFNMLLGQTGLLSFGHAVYFGLGAFFTAHAINFVKLGYIWFPISLMPLVGGLCGMFFGFIIGVITTRRPGTPFAMISLGIAEMVAASALMFITFFGGEAGIAVDRTSGGTVLGISYGPPLQVYFLVAIWCFVCIVLMYAITQTPLGRMANAVRDNEDRAKFVGYNPTRVRWMMLTLAAFFAGVAGGLYIITYEIVTAENLGILESGRVVLMAFIGGIGHFWGPIIGAILVTFLQSSLSIYTEAWLLYFGLLFLVIIMFSPGGIAGLIAMHKPAMNARLLGRLTKSYLLASSTGAIMLLALVALIEMIFHAESTIASGSLSFIGISIDTSVVYSWVVVLMVFIGGMYYFAKSMKIVRRDWEALGPLLQSKGVL